MTGPIRKPVPIPPALAGATRQELAELDDRELLAMAGSLPRFSQRRMAARELLVGRYRFLVWSCVQRYNRGPEPVEDLMQVGYVGLVAAINNFDPAVGCSLATYARSHINGEIKRYFRDLRWQVHVVRPVKELAIQARRLQAVAAHWGGLSPRQQKVLLLRFYDGMTQDQIGQQLGISQMQVSRLLSRALGYLRPRLLGLDEATAR